VQATRPISHQKKWHRNRIWHTIEFSNNRSPRNISQNHPTRPEATSLTYQIIASASNSFSQFKATAIDFRPHAQARSTAAFLKCEEGVRPPRPSRCPRPPSATRNTLPALPRASNLRPCGFHHRLPSEGGYPTRVLDRYPPGV
jgi:hypothetical protein